MALTVDLPQTNIGKALTGCYLRVTRLDADKEWLRFQVEAHVDEEARRDGRVCVFSGSYAVLPSSIVGELFPALYAHLKTLPEYAGAVDC